MLGSYNCIFVILHVMLLTENAEIEFYVTGFKLVHHGRHQNLPSAMSV